MVVMLVVALVTKSQFERLFAQTVGSFRESITSSRKQELKNYISLALSSIDHLDDQEALSESDAQKLVINVLSNLEYGEDGYFFAYDSQGNNLVHPKQPYRVGKN